jgi:hydroxymethylpyrimidine pyrophosphatase-like HAD family hydrolase
MKIRAILMDMDGTLLRKSQVAVSVHNMTAVQKAVYTICCRPSC